MFRYLFCLLLLLLPQVSFAEVRLAVLEFRGVGVSDGLLQLLTDEIRSGVLHVSKGQKIKGDGDAQRNAIYARAYNLDPDFFSFYRSMLAYETGVKEGTPIILSPESDFYRFFGDKEGRGN